MSTRCAYSTPLLRPASLHSCQNTYASSLCHASAQQGDGWARWCPRTPFQAHQSPLKRPRLARAPPFPSAPRPPHGQLTAARFRFLPLQVSAAGEIEDDPGCHGGSLGTDHELAFLAMLEFAHEQRQCRCLLVELRTPVSSTRAAAAAVARTSSRRAPLYRTLMPEYSYNY